MAEGELKAPQRALPAAPSESPSVPARVVEIDWSRWVPVDRATLVFIVEGDRILLIRKKRGLGAGKINGPGGRLEVGESLLACAVREVREELGVIPHNPVHFGQLMFQFLDGYSIHAHVYRADGCRGNPYETDEAIPLWTPLDGIPYDEMWADDRLWLPRVLAGEAFSGRFIFDGERMLDHELRDAAPVSDAELRAYETHA